MIEYYLGKIDRSPSLSSKSLKQPIWKSLQGDTVGLSTSKSKYSYNAKRSIGSLARIRSYTNAVGITSGQSVNIECNGTLFTLSSTEFNILNSACLGDMRCICCSLCMSNPSIYSCASSLNCS